MRASDGAEGARRPLSAQEACRQGSVTQPTPFHCGTAAAAAGFLVVCWLPVPAPSKHQTRAALDKTMPEGPENPLAKPKPTMTGVVGNRFTVSEGNQAASVGISTHAQVGGDRCARLQTRRPLTRGEHWGLFLSIWKRHCAPTACIRAAPGSCLGVYTATAAWRARLRATLVPTPGFGAPETTDVHGLGSWSSNAQLRYATVVANQSSRAAA